MKFLKRALPCFLAVLMCFLSLFSVPVSAAEVSYNLSSFGGSYQSKFETHPASDPNKPIDFAPGDFPLNLTVEYVSYLMSSTGSVSYTLQTSLFSFDIGTNYSFRWIFPFADFPVSVSKYVFLIVGFLPSSSLFPLQYSTGITVLADGTFSISDTLGRSYLSDISLDVLMRDGVPYGLLLSGSPSANFLNISLAVYGDTGTHNNVGYTGTLTTKYSSFNDFTVSFSAPSPTETFMSNLGSIFTSLLGVVPNLANMIITTPMFLVPIGLVAGGAAFGYLARGSKRE